MCWVCDSKSSIAEAYWTGRPSLSAHFDAAKATTALGIDGIGDKLGEPSPLLLITTDTIPDDTSSTATITVDGDHIISTIDTIGDQDFFQVELEAGGIYQIGQYAYVGGPSGVPLSDAYIEIYDAVGNLVVSADGGGPNTPSGLDALLTFVAEEGGTYYINARSFDNLPDNGTTGDEVGDYELFVDQVDPNDPGVYIPYYDVDSPLYAIDWGTQVNRVHQSVRNPDGDEGTRDTGNAQGDVPPNEFNITDKNVITIYFAQAGDLFTSLEDPTNPGLPPVLVSAGTQDWEKAVVMTALHEFEKVADVIYRVVDTREEADFFFTTYAGTPGPGVSLLGSMAPPDYPDEGLAQFNSGDYRWNEQDLQQGGFSFVTLIHEFGHGHGLAHPHDNGGNSGIMRGVEPEGPVADYTTGDFDLNQGVFTMMSYEDGWQTSPYGRAPTDVGYGYLGGLMAFDIAAIQDKYGVNEEWATGDNTYRLKDVNAAGTYYSSIWDAAGTDLMIYSGARNSVLDLRAATLQYEEGGGGRVSYANGIFGGFTIANGVTIEDARSGFGNDQLYGNDAANHLWSRTGNDLLRGFGGDDVLRGESGADGIFAGDGNDIGYGGLGDDVLGGQNGNDRLNGESGADTLNGGGGGDQLHGSEGRDTLVGGTGDDLLYGGAQLDMLTGEAGLDYFVFLDGDTSASRGLADRILDFAAGDKIHLAHMDADSTTAINEGFTFIGNQAFSGTAGELRTLTALGNTYVEGDVNGDGLVDFSIRVDGAVPLVATDFVL